MIPLFDSSVPWFCFVPNRRHFLPTRFENHAPTITGHAQSCCINQLMLKLQHRGDRHCVFATHETGML